MDQLSKLDQWKKLILTVIGLKIIQANSNISDRNLVLSIQVGLNGLSFLVLDLFTKKVELIRDIKFSEKITPQQLLKNLIEEFDSIDLLNENFTKIQVIHDNEVQTLVPSALFEEANLSDYLKFNAKIFKNDFITYDAITNQEIMSVYVPYVNVNNYIFEKFGSFEYKHSSTVIIDKVLQIEKNIKEKSLYVNVEKSNIDILVISSNSLIFYNKFNYNTKEDFIYFILFTIEQLELNPEKLNCKFLGSILNDDELFKIAYKYIRNVSIVSFKKMNYFKNKNTKHFTILNSYR
ncbi:MAG: DUF3822 family protein [Flavobacteriaceae bacterium]|jgi:hypothetical protein